MTPRSSGRVLKKHIFFISLILHCTEATIPVKLSHPASTIDDTIWNGATCKLLHSSSVQYCLYL